jgi:hypothetical protein
MLVLATLTVMEVEIREVSMATPRTAGKPRVMTDGDGNEHFCEFGERRKGRECGGRWWLVLSTTHNLLSPSSIPFSATTSLTTSLPVTDTSS